MEDNNKENKDDTMTNNESKGGGIPAVMVFVRVRPLTPSEEEQGFTTLNGLTLASSKEEEKKGNAVAFASFTTTSAAPIGGFCGVLGQQASNRDVFETCFEDQLPTVIRGGAASLFCYGYTGGGKTHTVIGYGEERGVFYLSAEALLSKLKAQQQDNNNDDDSLFLRATACEIYQDQVWDLIGEEKLPCTLRTNESGQLVVQRQNRSEQLEGVAATQTGKGHATLVTVAERPRATLVHTADDLQEIHKTCVTQRACGTSTTHHQSSRSHALLRLEVVSTATSRLQDQIQWIQAQIPALQNAVDNARTAQFTIKYSGYERVLRPKPLTESSHIANPGDLFIESVSDIGKICLRDVEGGNVSRTLEEWAQHLEEPMLQQRYVQILKEYPGGEAERSQLEKANNEELSRLEARLAQTERELEGVTRTHEELVANGPPALGGSIMLVDLAGADYDHRTGGEQKESIAINKSLLTLKECFRSLSNVSQRRPPFRESKLTRLLQDSLAPTEASLRRNKESVSVMLVNVSPAAQLEQGTLNALRYGQMYAGNGKSATGSRGRTAPKERAPTDPEVIAALWKIYQDKVPEKTPEQVQTILSNYAGREALLLAKVRVKYCC